MDVVNAYDEEEQELQSKDEIMSKFEDIERRWKVFRDDKKF